MKDVASLTADYKAAISQAKAIMDSVGSDPLTKEQSDKVTALYAKADETRLQIEQVKALADREAFLTEPAGPQAAHLGWRPAAPEEGNAPVDMKSWREFQIGVLTPRGVEQKTYRFNVPLAVQAKGYNSAYEAYLRKGLHNMGPADRKALSEGLDASGGYLVPEDPQTSILKKIATNAVMRQYARVITTSRDIVPWPRIKYTTNNEYTSGIRLTWTGETPSSATAHRVTDQIFGEYKIPVGTAMASQLISMDLIDDAAFDVLGISADLFAEAFGLGEEEKFWQGTGAIEPRGVLTDIGDTTDYNAAVNKADGANAVIAADLLDVAYSLPAQYERNARWFMSKSTAKQIRALTDTNGDYLWPAWNQFGNLAPAPGEILGYPVTYSEMTDDISSASDTPSYPLVLGDMSAYAIVDRVGLSIKRDENLYAETNQVLLLGKKRVGGQLVESYKLACLKTGNTTEA